MVERSVRSEMRVCVRCGCHYRPPQWGREYLCAGCGAPLGVQARKRRPFAIPSWLLPGATAVVLAVVVMRLANDRLRQRFAPRPVPAAVAPEEIRPPPHLEERLRQKIELVSDDLRREPGQWVLLATLAETYLYRAVLDRDRDPAKSARWVAKSRAAVRELSAEEPVLAAQMEIDIQEWRRLRWTSSSNSTLAISLWTRARGGSIYPLVAPTPQLSPGAAAAVGGGAGPGGGVVERPAVQREDAGVPMSSAFTPSGAGAQNRPPDSSGDVGRARLPSIARTEARTNTRPAPQVPDLPPTTPAAIQVAVFRNLDRDIQRLRAAFRAAPADSTTTEALVQELVSRGDLEVRYSGRHREQGEATQRAYLKQAAEVYASAARHATLRMHRAAFFRAAADMFGRAEEYEAQYHALVEATRAAPYAARVWRELQAVCLRTMRSRESQEARIRFREWSFPGLHPR